MTKLALFISTTADGTMLDRSGDFHAEQILANRQGFCSKNGIDYTDVVYHRINYGSEQTYSSIAEVNEGHTSKHVPEVAADALLTTQPGVGIMLPVADCVATCVYDPVAGILAIMHLGRHATLTNIVAKMIATFTNLGSNLADIQVHTSPATQRASYKMQYFDHADDPAWQGFYDKTPDGYYLDLPGYNRQKFMEAGVLSENISISPIDTATSPDYFSHQQGDTASRFVMLAMMK